MPGLLVVGSILRSSRILKGKLLLASPLKRSSLLGKTDTMKIFILLFRIFLVWLSLSVIDMFAKQFGYGSWDSGPWGYLLLAVQIAVGLVVWNLSARFKRD